MSESRAVSPEILSHIAQQIQVPASGLVAVIDLLDGGGTVPFIARYRKEVTGNLDEVKVREIEELKARIEQCLEKGELEDLYLPYKPKRRTKATIAREKGLEPLANYLWAQQPADQPLNALVSGFINAELGVANADEALEGARHIVAE